MTNTLWSKIEPFLKSLQKPAQYIGGETNAIIKDPATVQFHVCLVFPDTYEIGMSHTGLKILYNILNQRSDVAAERCFAPLLDMEALLRSQKIPLFSLETKTPLAEFDIIGITLPHELVYTNVLNILDLAGLPLLSKDRDERHPLIIGGGPSAYNPEPIADFFDAFGLGDGEELIVDVMERCLGAKVSGFLGSACTTQQLRHIDTQTPRHSLLKSLATIPGLYIPSFFEPRYNPDGTLAETKPLLAGYTGVQKRIVTDLNQQPYPLFPIIPNIRPVHDRIDIEIQRGCTRGCRFCQAGMVERPVRQREPNVILNIAETSFANSGIDEISLLSLSAGDYPQIPELLKDLNTLNCERRVSLSVPATRTETLTPEILDEIKKVRMTGFTIAPEAGSERLRRVINKGNRLEDLLTACRNAFNAGYRLIKFYFMCGLPFEMDEDVVGIAREASAALELGKTFRKDIQINLSLSTFIPKPFTPFQWKPQISIEETHHKHTLIKSQLKHRAIHFKYHDPRMSFIEGLFARGDRRLSHLILTAFQNGCRFDEWTEHFRFDLWQKSLDQTKTDTNFYLYRKRNRDEILPWDHLFSQMKKEWLWEEHEKAQTEAFTSDCTIEGTCTGCGVCGVTKHELTSVRAHELTPTGFKDNDQKLTTVRSSPSFVEHRPLDSFVRSCARELVSSTAMSPINSQPISKIRVRFSKIGPAMFFSHLELMGILKRAIERSKTPVVYSKGFHPQMRISLGPALPLGLESEWEFFDLSLTKTIQVDDFINNINKALPAGVRILSAEYVDLKASSIYLATKFVNYTARFSDEIPGGVLKQVQKNIGSLKNHEEFVVQRVSYKDKKQRFFKLSEHIDPSGVKLAERVLSFDLRCTDQGSVKPIEVVSALSGLTKEELNFVRVSKVGVLMK